MNEQDMSGNEQENIAGQAMEGLGIPEEAANESAALEGKVDEDVPASMQKRLGKQAERHRKEMRMMQEQMSSLQSQMGQPREMQQQPDQHQSPTGQPEGDGVNDQINRAVAAALRAKDDHEAQQKQQMAEKERHEHMQKQYQEMDQDFDKAAEKYEDFDDVVRHPNAPFSPAMRDYALTLPNRAEVLYKLGKNPEELGRISKLRPIDQAKEMFKLSVALMGGGSKPEVPPRPMGQIKGNPVASHAVNEKTSVGDIRSRMKSGNWK